MRSEINKIEGTVASTINRNDVALEVNHPIVLAIDSARVQEAQLRKVLLWLGYWNLNDQQLMPVSVYSNFELGWFVTPDSKQKRMTLEFVKSEVDKKWNKISTTQSVNILVSDKGQNSTRDKVFKLIEFAKGKKAEVIVTISRAQSRNELIGLGSFTESLIAISPKPVLVMGEKMRDPGPIRNIFYPSDFSVSSRKTFKSIVKFAKKLKASVTLFHFFNVDMGPSAVGIPWGYEMAWIDEMWRVQEEKMRMEGNSWSQWAQNQGVNCEFVCERESGPLRKMIISGSKRCGADVIGLNIKRGPMAQVILGRTVRSVFAHADCPVLAIHSEEHQTHAHS